ncbi:MAG: hypothetical protein FJW40_04555 [Acidobacteria bacterium]|nr:hypothetical protein [Acidobacteriota bacterium]
MSFSRRGLLAGAGLTVIARGAAPAAKSRELSRELTRDELPTPCMVLDLDMFDANVRHMADHSKAAGISVRPHVKIHKSADIAKRQQTAGAIGVTTATIAEAELMSAAGIKGVLWTMQPAGKHKIQRAVALSRRDPHFMLVADDPITADMLDEAAAAQGTKVRVVVDIFAGLTRHGIAGGAEAFALAQKIEQSKNLKFGGLMAYSGIASHTKGWEKRREQSMKDIAGLKETAEMCRKSGLTPGILTGGSTGTYNIDPGHLTELQAGSYIFMDTGYTKIGSKDQAGDRYSDFKSSLTVLTTVVSARHKGQVTIDAGNKALLRPTDEVKGHPRMIIENQGAEYGIVKFNGDRELKLGERIELYPTNLDMSTNVYDKYYIARGDRIIDAWPIMGRAGAAQR